MKVVILAGDLGTRISEETSIKPKPMIEIGGKPILWHIMQEKFGLQYEINQAATSINATGAKPHYYSRNTRAAEFGYQPTLTSFEGVLQQVAAILQNSKTSIY